MSLNLVGIGALGLMLSPAARHLTPDGPARFLRIHDRGHRDARRDRAREQWRAHGAALVPSFDELVGDGDLDGVVICAGKNGDDLLILRELVPRLVRRCTQPPFILHLSTVSVSFVAAALAFCTRHGIRYANYPLTGGPAGAEAATMLILASGDRHLYDTLLPMLSRLGKPKYFGERVTAGAEVKLMGQFMVFNGLNGISSAAALHAACFELTIGDQSQVEFFEFLNQGAGGTRQWEVALSKGLRDHVWDQGFLVHHAAVDAVYAAQLAYQKGLPHYSIMPMVLTVLAFAYLLKQQPHPPLATHAVVRELVGEAARHLDKFFEPFLDGPRENLLDLCVQALPPRVRETVRLDITEQDFESPSRKP